MKISLTIFLSIATVFMSQSGCVETDKKMESDYCALDEAKPTAKW